MQVIISCLFIAVLLPILSKVPVAFAQNSAGGYDNRHPRSQQAKLTGFGARALAAHENAFEALIMFAPAALTSIAVGQTGYWAQWLAIGFVVARLTYLGCYLVNWHLLRSIVWGVGYLCSIGLFVLVLIG